MQEPTSQTLKSGAAQASGEKKRTLESDEEDNVDDYERLDEDDIEGQEDDTIAFDGNIAITPFNMKEEMQTGHFDKTGTYIFDKEEEIRDGWMDNIDWVRVKNKDSKEGDTTAGSDHLSEPEQIDTLATRKEMVAIMQPGESVAKALRRLGGAQKKMTSAQRLKAKKQGIKPTEEELKQQKLFQSLTSLADLLIQTGYMEIYDDTYEKLTYQISQSEQQTKKRALEDEDAALDMFGEDFDEKQAKSDGADEPAEKKVKADVGLSVNTDEVMWEYRLKNEDGAEIHGPHSSQDMEEWTDENRFPDGVFVRKVGSGSDFYSSRRIDFGLYT